VLVVSLQSRIVEIDQRKRLAPVVLGKYITEGSKTTDKKMHANPSYIGDVERERPRF
jgi:hypothetical protein